MPGDILSEFDADDFSAIGTGNFDSTPELLLIIARNFDLSAAKRATRS
jgi:hypothetical protein